MNNTNLNHTKKKLTVIFSLLVFAIAVLLESVFFTTKYVGYIKQETDNFDNLTHSVENKFVSLNEFIGMYDVKQRVFDMRIKKKRPGVKHLNEQFVNFIIIDREKKELVFSNIVDNLDIEFIKHELVEDDNNKIEQEHGYLVRKVTVNENKREYQILFIKNLKYSFSDYLTDLFGFIFITLMFSVVFYYVGLKFVSRNLKPVEENMKDMQDFIHNAGHELKTPIAVIHSNLQLIKQTKAFDENLIKEGLTEINRLDKLIESLVELSNINGSNNIYDINLKTEIKSIIKDFKVESEKKDLKIILESDFEKIVKINKQYFYILFSNLLGNSIKYTNLGGEINIILGKDKFIIKDTGIGIKRENLEKIFERFFMCEGSRNNDGYGIGLSLVKKITNIYNWRIDVKSDYGKGTEFIIYF